MTSDELSRPRDTVICLNSGQVIKVWVNRDIFSPAGSLKQFSFKDGKDIHLLSFKWLEGNDTTTVISHWIPKITARNAGRKVDFMRDTAENICLDKWEVVKNVMASLLTVHNANLLEVTFWGIKLGHRDVQSAHKVMENKAMVMQLLEFMLADREFTFSDVIVDWATTITSDLRGPVQESSGIGSEMITSSSLSMFSVENCCELEAFTEEGQEMHTLDDNASGSEENWRRLFNAINDLKQSSEELHRKVDKIMNLEDILKDIRSHPLASTDGSSRLSLQVVPLMRAEETDENAAYPPRQNSQGEHNRTENVAVQNRTEQTESKFIEPSTSEREVNKARGQESNSCRNRDLVTSANPSTQISHRAWNDSSETVTQQQSKQRERSYKTGSSVEPALNRDNFQREGASTVQGQFERSPSRPLLKLTAGDDNSRNGNIVSGASIKENSKQDNNHPFQNNKENRSSTNAMNTQNSSPAHQPAASRVCQQTTNNSSRYSPSTARLAGAGGAEGRENMTSSHQSSSRRSQSYSTGLPASDRQTDKIKSVSSEMMRIECDSEDEVELLRESVGKAYLEDEEKAPKAKSFDTMLCLDISESMKEGGAFEAMKRAALSFIDGVDDEVASTGIEENIGLVTFGGRANVVQNLTNDFSRIRDKIDDLQPGGKSPFVEALLVSMAAFAGKGGVVSISGEWSVKPRIIFISDGKPTESAKTGGRDYVNNDSNVRLSVSKMLLRFKTSDNFNKVHPVFFVPVGQNADKQYMEAMAKICDGVYTLPEKITDLCHYFKIQETIGKVLVCLRRESENAVEEKIGATVTALTPDLSEQDKTKIIEAVSKELENPTKMPKRRPRPTELEYVFEDTDGVNKGERLPLGTRVLRGPDWDWGDQDAGGPGTVISHNENHSIHWVKWDNAEYNRYPYSPHRGYHIWKTEEHPRIKKDNEPLEIGMTVRKGPDWNTDESQTNQGAGKGVIIRKSSEKGKVVVRWSNGDIQIYQWSPSGRKEVEYCSPYEDVDVSQQNSPHSDHANPCTSQNEPMAFKGKGIWQWKDVDDCWKPYSEVINQEIEAACKKKNSRTCIITRDGKQRRMMFRKMMEKVIDEGTECEIRRIQMD